MAITAQMVKELREKTGAGMMECKKALETSGGDFNKAIDILRQKGLATAQKKASREAKEGIITSYIHMDKIGVMLELNCETDFVARNEEFRQLAKDIAMQIAASNPQYIQREDIPQEVIEKEKEIYKSQIKGNKPPQVIEKIVEGKLEKFFEEMCLLDQPFIKEPEKKIKDLITEKVAKFGENIMVRRFVRFQVGQTQDE
ncbi:MULTISPECIES: translation elongation factor Ts [Thermodesulfovibrio]|uniref:Elongation factor Ts n=2 Tax=Thermodesulfovibrio yellowstonii TaxID=28262 RepID=EFTS_THEYD|nr:MULTISPECIES: translation elongation factor Ts [Thermodesulfovibrio]B5YGE0.1 RecName: Full=Elongation factor Ts; Short=EF-Ts [Thermodesulfovibrio yellowstonii DSM 11347]ACI20484.1 translation elongation factor Ts [Thermodesulfovibrio yellowstonii DSM 11347]MDI6865140.1 translation elongation factor Ts [Thermodesulfovibrio yellowstonii]GLI53069.1 elongation factor Ts [Thermodesulfovibrio islandicus]